jgi:hypothetical protein
MLAQDVSVVKQMQEPLSEESPQTQTCGFAAPGCNTNPRRMNKKQNAAIFRL